MECNSTITFQAGFERTLALSFLSARGHRIDASGQILVSLRPISACVHSHHCRHGCNTGFKSVYFGAGK